MKITVFTSNQPRHVALVSALAGIAEQVYAVQECNTLFPGEVEDFFRKSEVMQRYFRRVIDAERQVFGGARFPPANVRTLALRMGDLNRLPLTVLEPALDSDVHVVFGSSYIKGALCDALVERGALNIHMGMSPWYRGSSCNFWALYDRRPDLVGATVHRLSAGLDSGAMLFHAVPPAGARDGFLLGMQAVAAAHAGLLERLRDGSLDRLEAVPQDRALEIRYTRNRDFTDEVAGRYLAEGIGDEEIGARLAVRDTAALLRPYVPGQA
jgi:hypothetical protein